MIEFYCWNCGRLFKVGDSRAGAHASCNACGAPVHVPVPPHAAGPLDAPTPVDARGIMTTLKRYAERHEQDLKRLAEFRKTMTLVEERLRRDSADATAIQRAGEIEREHRELTVRLERVSAQLEQSEAEVRRLSEAMSASTDVPEFMEERLARMREELDAERDARAAAEDRAAEAERREAAREQSNHALTRDLDEERQRRLNLDMQIAEVQAELRLLAREHAEARDARERADSALLAATERASRLDEQVRSRSEELAELRARIADAESVGEETRAALARMSEKDALISRLTNELAGVSQARGEAQTRAEQRERELAETRERAEDEARRAEAALAEAHEEARGLREQLDAERAARRDMEHALHDARLRMETLETQLAALSKEMSEQRDRDRAAEAIENDIRSAVSRLEAKEEALARLTAELSTISTSLGAADARAQEMAGDLERAAAALHAGRDARALEPVPLTRDNRPDIAQGEPDVGITLIPEVVDEDELKQDTEMLDMLMRFIEPS